MQLHISHRTTYAFDEPIHYGLERLRVRPRTGPTQSVIEWDVHLDGASTEVEYTDYLANHISLTRLEAGATEITIDATGVVDTHRTDGIIGPHREPIGLWYFATGTALTTPGPGIEAIVAEVAVTPDDVVSLHDLSNATRDRVEYSIGQTDAETTAEQALESGVGVCQDHTHIFIAAARLAGIPARYVSGYLFIEGQEGQVQDAGHAWAEAFVGGLGWVGFDVSNRVSADERYVRVAVGRDYLEAAPITGVRYGPGDETLQVALSVNQ